VSAEAWPVEFERRADNDLERLDPPVRERVFTALERLANDPYSAGLRKLAGGPEWRLRVGDWSVIVELDVAQRTIVVLRVLPRGRAYDR
jgi:mRNA interferase RelE/StbE